MCMQHRVQEQLQLCSTHVEEIIHEIPPAALGNLENVEHNRVPIAADATIGQEPLVNDPCSLRSDVPGRSAANVTDAFVESIDPR